MKRHFLIPFCGVMLALTAFSCDIMLPAFFDIERDLGGPIGRVQAVIPIFLIAAGGGQLIFGMLSDRFGRKPVMEAGLLFYIAGSLLAITATALWALYVSRMLQGLGAACGVVVARAILRDTHGGAELARAMSLAMAVFSIGPLTAPLLGAGLVAISGWRGAFIAMTLFGTGLLIASRLGFVETNMAPDPTATQFARIKQSMRRVLTNAQSRHFLAIAIVMQSAVTLMVVNTPRIYKTAFGIEGSAFAGWFALSAIGIVIGQLIANRAIARFGVINTQRAASLIFLADSLLIAFAARTGALTVEVFVAMMIVFSASFLVILANCISLVIDPHKEIAGFAASIYGFISQFIGSILALGLLQLVDGTMLGWSEAQVVIAAIVMLASVLYKPTPHLARL
jgi:DHA1 family bicyclomycin/chloramphenicol resistance-like MFS transporter